MRSKIYLFRHGQTDWNKEGRFQGHTDIPLNSNGEQEANELKAFVNQLKPDMLVSSDLIRAQRTAQIINSELNLPIVTTSALRETHLGDAEGVYNFEIESLFGANALDQWSSIDIKTLHFGFPNGETKKQVIDRVLNYLEGILRSKQVSQLAVSTHGGVIKRICHYIADLPHEKVPIKNCCLYELEFLHNEKKWVFGRQHK
jgi:broad specificity phosphatase PhoE